MSLFRFFHIVNERDEREFPETRTTQCRQGKASRREQRKLDLTPSDRVISLTRVRYLGGAPIVHDALLSPQSSFPDSSRRNLKTRPMPYIRPTTRIWRGHHQGRRTPEGGSCDRPECRGPGHRPRNAVAAGRSRRPRASRQSHRVAPESLPHRPLRVPERVGVNLRVMDGNPSRSIAAAPPRRWPDRISTRTFRVVLSIAHSDRCILGGARVAGADLSAAGFTEITKTLCFASSAELYSTPPATAVAHVSAIP